MEQHGIFSRMVQKFRFSKGGRNGNGAFPPAATIDGGELPPADSDAVTAVVPSMVRASRKERNELTLETLQEGYNKVVGLVESIQDHLDTQERRTEQLVEAMSQLAGNMASLPRETAKQTEALTGAMATMQKGAAASEQLTQRLMNAQHETSSRVATTLDGLSGSVASLGEVTRASTEALQAMHDSAAQRDERLAVLFAEQTKRFTVVFSFAITLAVIAAVTGVVALLR